MSLPTGPRGRRRLLAAMLTATVLLTGSAVVPATAAPEPALAASNLIVDGHGWGHRRGLGQYGALGYAIDHGWTTAQILNHFYGGTTAGSVDPNTEMTARIVSQDAQPLLVQVDAGNLVTFVPGGGYVPAKSRALKIERVTGGFRVSDAATCAGPWTVRSGTVSGSDLRVRSAIIGSTTFSFGTPGDRPLTGDWNGDGVDTIGIWRNGQVYLRNSPAGGPAEVAYSFGTSGDTPIAGDWNGDGIDTVGVRRGSAIYLRNSHTSGPANVSFSYGVASDVAVSGDWDGNGTDTIGIRRGGTWYLRNSNSSGGANVSLSFGVASDLPVVGNWDGTGADGVGVRRGTTFHIRNPLTSGPATSSFDALGSGTPLAGRWKGVASEWVGRFSGNVWEQAGAANGGGGITVPPANDLDLSRTLQLCHAAFGGGRSATPTTTRYYRGELRAVFDGATLRTVDSLGLDWYLRGVVPRESPASWGTLDCAGGTPDCGQRALEAQAVAARSYAMGEARAPYAKTCDTTSCQVYGGRAHRTSGGSPVVDEPSQTNAAVATMSGQVRRTGSGAVARTEFSSSTGGLTAGGLFPPVWDAGDDTASNPNHSWDVVLTPAAIEQKYGRPAGSYVSATITSRSSSTTAGNYQAVTGVQIVFSSGVPVNRTGEAFRIEWSQNGAGNSVMSSWFDFR